MGTETLKQNEPFKAFDLKGKMVAAGKTREEAKERAEAQGVEKPLILRIRVVKRSSEELTTGDGAQTHEPPPSGRDRE